MNSGVNSLIEILREVLTGIAQIMLQPSPMVGVAFLAGAFLNSPILAIFALVGCLSSTLTAWALKFPDEERYDGLYGFNGGLVGLGTGYFYDTQAWLLAFVVVGGMITSIIMYRMLRGGIRPFTFPFVVTTWMIMLLLTATGWASPTVWSEPDSTSFNILDGMARGYGQVLFQEHVLTGLIFVAAIAIRDWVQGLYATLATILGLVCGLVMGFPIDAVNLGLFGYNGVLCAILFAGRSGKDFISAVTAILFSVVIVRLFHIAGFPALTFPFVVSSWFVLWGKSKRFANIP